MKIYYQFCIKPRAEERELLLNFKIIVEVDGDKSVKTGVVIDYKDVKKLCFDVEEALDHKSLNDILENPTSENLAEWIFEKLDDKFDALKESLRLESVSVYESENCWSKWTRLDDQRRLATS